MQQFTDDALGEIIVRKSNRARAVRISLRTDGRLMATAPTLTPLFMIKRIVASARDELITLKQGSIAHTDYTDGQAVGKKHSIAVVSTQMVATPVVTAIRGRIVVKLPPGSHITDSFVQQSIRDSVVTVLRREAKQYLPSQLQQLARAHGFSYKKLRFSHSGGRWGSCSSNGTISLNIALMKLPDELITYVLVHELCHTIHMNHSAAFWASVRSIDPHYKLHRRQIAKHTPVV